MLDRLSDTASAPREPPPVNIAFGFGGAELRPARPAELIAPLSGAFDLAESQPVGHAARVAHIATAVAERLDLDAATRRSVLYTGLLHDAGAAVRALPEGVDGRGGHTAAGAWVASRFGLDEHVQEAIRCSHERWDGRGRPRRLAMDQVPLESLIVSAAHWASDLERDSENPLRARARLVSTSPRDVEPVVGRRVAEALGRVMREDATWMALSGDGLPSRVASAASGEGRGSLRTVERIATVMGELVDASVREPGRSQRVAALAGQLAAGAGVSARERQALVVAALLLDVGQLGVPHHIVDKPTVLAVDEMELVRHHPGWAARIVETIPGMEQIALWVEAHHERPDGRGYGELLVGDQIPLASRVLAVADSYWALRAPRPYGEAFGDAEALKIIEAGAGAQYDAELVELLGPALAACEARAEGPRTAAAA